MYVRSLPATKKSKAVASTFAQLGRIEQQGTGSTDHCAVWTSEVKTLLLQVFCTLVQGLGLSSPHA